jgi:glycosyltransferase involved in cell wall biosynthesis
VVMRLSDFFLVCPNALLYRDGGICEECIHGSLFNAVRHKCIKNSTSASLIKVCAMYFHRILHIYANVRYIVAPSTFTLGMMQSAIAKEKLVHIPTFISEKSEYNAKVGTYILYAGRVEEEKGILLAVKAVQGTPYKLFIAGSSSTGYDEIIARYLQAHNIRNVKLLGSKHGKELRDLYRNARFLICPVQWYENMPNMVLEAMMHSKPVLASNLGSLKEIIHDNRNGLLFEPNDVEGLRTKIALLCADNSLCRRLGKNAYRDAVTIYSPEKHYGILIALFNKAVNDEGNQKKDRSRNKQK